MNDRDARSRTTTDDENSTNDSPTSTGWSQSQRQHRYQHQHQHQQQQRQQQEQQHQHQRHQPTIMPSTPSTAYNSQAVPFRSQLDAFAYPNPAMHAVNVVDPRSQGAFDMAALAGHLPTSVHYTQYTAMHTQPPYDRSSMPNTQPFVPRLPMPYGFQTQEHPASPYDPNSPRNSEMAYGGVPMDMPLPPSVPQSQDLYTGVYGPYGSLANSQHVVYNTSDFAHPGLTDHHAFMRSRQVSDTAAAPIPAFPRGPPRRPKQSGYALWVGNLPPNATVTELKDHFSREATKDIESLFLISKSNCAFVNYRTEAACTAAVNRFHDSRFNGVRLVCRLRRGSNSTTQVSLPTILIPPMQESLGDTATLQALMDKAEEQEDESLPVIVGQTPQQLVESSAQDAPATTVWTNERVPEKFFIVKSLTVQDLEASVRNGIWSTQSHNEHILNQAYEHADNVFLIFSANKSGEYFGYARMTSPISTEPVNLHTEFNDKTYTGNPQSIPTSATTTAPRGHIIDDSARGTIFWEAELSDAEEGGDTLRQEEYSGDEDQRWGRQFKIEWHSTARLPFFRTRGLRNPWNSNREVKIARDGTELEPAVGRRLIQMFHRPPPPMNVPIPLPGVAIPPHH